MCLSHQHGLWTLFPRVSPNPSSLLHVHGQHLAQASVFSNQGCGSHNRLLPWVPRPHQPPSCFSKASDSTCQTQKSLRPTSSLNLEPSPRSSEGWFPPALLGLAHKPTPRKACPNQPPGPPQTLSAPTDAFLRTAWPDICCPAPSPRGLSEGRECVLLICIRMPL